MATYYAWKAKYAGLTPSGVRNRRLRDRRKRQTTMAAFGVLVLCVGAAGMFVTTRNASQPPNAASQPPNASANAPENSLESPPAAPAATVTIPAAAPDTQGTAGGGALQSSAVRPPSQGADAESAGLRAGAPWANAEDIESADPNDYVVQVAAVPDLREARAVLDQLAEAGYHAYLTAAVIDQVELYRVRVGPLKSRNEAQDIARRLEREGHRAPWVTK
jgi:DedD protein